MAILFSENTTLIGTEIANPQTCESTENEPAEWVRIEFACRLPDNCASREREVVYRDSLFFLARGGNLKYLFRL